MRFKLFVLGCAGLLMLAGCASTERGFARSQQVLLEDTGSDADNMGGDIDTSGTFWDSETDASFNAAIRGRVEPLYIAQAGYGDVIGSHKAAASAKEQMQIQRSGWIKLDVSKEISFSAKLRKMAGQFDAMVMSFNDHEVTYKMSASKLESLIEKMESLDDVDVDAYDFRAYDRTGEYYSIDDRREAAEALRARLMKMMETAVDVDTLLRIEKEIEAAQVRIDKFRAAKRDIERRAGLVDVRILLD